jgi:hypothetical protein
MALNSLRKNHNILYRLKRENGQTITIGKVVSITNNYETGASVKNFSSYPIRRAIIGPAFDERVFSQGLTFVRSNQNFTYGGDFDRERNGVILDAKDVQEPITPDMLIVLHSKIYGIEKTQFTESDAAWILNMYRLSNSQINEQQLMLNEDGTYILNEDTTNIRI